MAIINIDQLDYSSKNEHPISDVHWIKSEIIKHHSECLQSTENITPIPFSHIVKEKNGIKIAGNVG